MLTEISIVSFISCLLLGGSEALVPSVVSTFVNLNSSNAHLVVHRLTGLVYVGATNKVYQLSPALEVIGVRRLGPYEDSLRCKTYYDLENQQCDIGEDSFGGRSQLTDNYNKVLVIDYDRDQLVVCGSVYQGVCWILSLSNFTGAKRDPELVPRPIVANDGASSTVAFIAPGPPYPNIHKVLNVAVTYTGNSPFRSQVPAISSRRLTGHKGEILDIVADETPAFGSNNEAAIYFRHNQDFRVKYVYGFSSKGFSYFLAVQKSEKSSRKFVSKIIRVCQKDSNYDSYVEIPISCKDKSGSRYFPIVQSAVIGRVGPELAKELEDSVLDDVLFATFSGAQAGSWNSSGGSALCLFPMRDIRKKFEENIQECFAGRGYRGAEHIEVQNWCQFDRSIEITEEYCGSPVNSPLGGTLSMEKEATMTFDAVLTSIAVTVTGDFTVAFLGTRSGAVKKVVLESLDGGTEYESISIDSSRPILPDMKLDPPKTHLYVMTKTKVQKLKLHAACEYKTSCSECLQDGDPFCAWCPALNKCMENGARHSCPRSYIPSAESPNWLSYKTQDFCPNEMALCPDLAETCSKCLALDPKYECGWCGDKGNCLQIRHCEAGHTWINVTERCDTTPFIEFFHPTSGPVEGGTNVTISIPNIYSFLTTSMIGASMQITVAGSPCKKTSAIGRTFANPTPEEKVTCRIPRGPKGQIDLSAVRIGPVIIQVHDLRLESTEKFAFVNPVISDISPTRGPVRGGSKLNLTGENMDAGNEAQVFIGPTACQVTRRGQSFIECVTNENPDAGNYSLRVLFDGNERYFPSGFAYVSNPEIYRTKPNVIHSTLSGGYHLTAEGINFDGVQRAYFVVLINSTEYQGPCNVTSSTSLYCTTPTITESVENIKGIGVATLEHGVEEDMVILNFKFLLDTVDTYINDRPEAKHEYFLRLTHSHNHDHEHGSSTATTLISIALILLFIILSGILYVLYKRYRLKRKIHNTAAILTETELKEFHRGKPNSVDKDMDEPLGSGMFGLVLRGTVDQVPAAVKTTKPDAEKMHLTALMSELKILIHLGNSGKHPNIVNLVGAYTKKIDTGLLYMFVEYCPLGSLDKRLRSSRKLFCNQVHDDVIDLSSGNPKRYENVDPKDIMCTFDLVNYAHQVAKGMEYLAEKKVIHADLAARNLLLLNQTTVKITDFGLARKLYDYTNYVKKHQEPLPWRWMALEALQDLSFSSQSDVWSYGVTLWEMFTLGELPYPGLSWSVDFVDRLVHGLKNVWPRFATSDIYNTMLECWQHKPEDRPTFTELRKFFNSVLQDLSSQVQEAHDDEGYLVPLLQQQSGTQV